MNSAETLKLNKDFRQAMKKKDTSVKDYLRAFDSFTKYVTINGAYRICPSHLKANSQNHRKSWSKGSPSAPKSAVFLMRKLKSITVGNISTII